MKLITVLSTIACILGMLGIMQPAAAQDETSESMLLRLNKIESQLDQILVTLQEMEAKSKREEYFAGCVSESTRCTRGGICGANETSRWVAEDPKCGNPPQDVVFGCYCKDS